jgi:hypothetical protein
VAKLAARLLAKGSSLAGGYKEMSAIFTGYSALLYKSQFGGWWGVGLRGSANEYSCAHHVTWSPNKLRRSTFIFNLCSLGANPDIPQKYKVGVISKGVDKTL